MIDERGHEAILELLRRLFSPIQSAVFAARCQALGRVIDDRRLALVASGAEWEGVFDAVCLELLELGEPLCFEFLVDRVSTHAEKELS